MQGRYISYGVYRDCKRWVFRASVGITETNITIIELNTGTAEVNALIMLFVINLRL
jgi:hypothetical protein